MQASDSSLAVASPEFPVARFCSLKQVPNARFSTRVVKERNGPVEDPEQRTDQGELPVTVNPFGSRLAHRKEKNFRRAAGVSHEQAQPLGIDARVVRRGRDALMVEQRLDVTRVSSPLVEKVAAVCRSGCAEMTGTRARSRASLSVRRRPDC